MKPVQVGRWLVTTTLLGLAATACGGGSGSDVDGGSNGSGNGTGKGTAASGPDLGNLGGSNGSGGTSGNGDIGDTCAGELIEAKSIPLDMYVMLDSSGSMLDPTEGNVLLSKWEAVSQALLDFAEDPESSGIGMGLQRFPLNHPDAPEQCTSNAQCGDEFGPCFLKACWPPTTGLFPCQTSLDCDSLRCVTFGVCENDPDNYVCPTVGDACGFDDDGVDLGDCVTAPPSFCLLTADCRASSYAAPAAPIAELPDARDAVLAAIQSADPEGLTPSGPALKGAIDQASSWAAAHPDHQVVAVLATDGLPTLEAAGNSCEPVVQQSQVDAVAQLAADGRAATPAISTFVIGVLGAGDVGGAETLGAIAAAGGTGDAFVVDTKGDVAAQFRDALNQIRGTRLACELAVPEADAGKTVDFNLVNVTFDDGGGPSTLFYVEDASGCDATSGGWYYDKLPTDGAPERIVVCPTTCEQFGAADTGSVQIKLGCTTKVK